MARSSGVVALALTDHDCLDGLAAFRAAARDFLPIDGVEVSARRGDRDVHVLGLFIDPADALFRERLGTLARGRIERTRAMVDRLRRAGIDIDEEAVRALAGEGTIGRPHLAAALVERGAASSVEEAFRRFLRPGTPGYVSKPGPTPPEAIAWIHEAGGAAVLAHPGLLSPPREIEDYAGAGLDGIEVWHPRHVAAQRASFLALAERLDLVPTGGSDYHGPGIGDAVIGQEPVPPETVDRLRARAPRG
jgi:predicted metal-dependent phosphoesterase TrpH